MVSTHIETVGDVTGSKTTNEEWFTTDLQTEMTHGSHEASKFRICCAIDNGRKVQVTLDSGTYWAYLNGGDTLVQDSIYILEVPIREGDLFNMRADGDCDVKICRVSEVTMEG